jgi:hypothetical protein
VVGREWVGLTEGPQQRKIKADLAYEDSASHQTSLGQVRRVRAGRKEPKIGNMGNGVRPMMRVCRIPNDKGHERNRRMSQGRRKSLDHPFSVFLPDAES